MADSFGSLLAGLTSLRTGRREKSDRSSCCLRSCVRVWGAQEVDWTIRTKEDLLACEAAGGIPIFERFDPEA